MKYTTEKLKTKRELLNTQIQIFTDIILSYISIDEDEIICYLKKNRLLRYSNQDNFVLSEYMYKIMIYEWRFLESYWVENFANSFRDFERAEYDFFRIVANSVAFLDASDLVTAILENIKKQSQEKQNKKVEILMFAILENGSCINVFNVVKKKLSPENLYFHFQRTFQTRSLNVLKIFICENPQYGYFIHSKPRPYRTYIHFYVGVRSKLYYM